MGGGSIVLRGVETLAEHKKGGRFGGGEVEARVSE